jgi:DNA primase
MVDALTPGMIDRLAELRGFTPEAVKALGLGFSPADKRIVFPARDAAGTVVGFSKWLPNPATRGSRAKNIAEGPRELFPPPEFIEGTNVWLVEGEPDAVAMASMGLPAVAAPGVGTWKKDWTARFAEFEKVRILFDCDEEGRKAADARQAQLAKVTSVQVVDLDPERNDRYDVGDLLLEHGESAAAKLAALATTSTGTVMWLHDPKPPDDGRRPIEKVMEALDGHDCRPRRGATDHQYEARCPNHADKHPSLSVAEGDDGRVLLTCHAGCEPDEVLNALGLDWKDAFAA